MREPRKPWSKPEMIVLVRGKSEESVLAGCKGTGNLGDPNNAFDNCMDSGAPCPACSVVASS